MITPKPNVASSILVERTNSIPGNKNAELDELIRQGYLDEDYTKQDVVKLCNPQTDIEREHSKGADAMFSCVTKGNW